MPDEKKTSDFDSWIAGMEEPQYGVMAADTATAEDPPEECLTWTSDRDSVTVRIAPARKIPKRSSTE